MYDTKLLINTCDAYSDVLKILFASLSENWPDIPFSVVINSESNAYCEYDAKSHLANSSIKTWGQRLRSTLEDIDSEFVLVIYDDFILEKKVDNQNIFDALQLLRDDSEASVVYLGNTNLPTVNESNNLKFLKIKNNCDYRLSSNPAIWRRLDLLAVTGKFDTPWAWEVFGSHRRLVNKKTFYTLNPFFEDIYKYDHKHGGAIYRGKWVKSVVFEKVKKYNLDIDLAKRGFADDLVFEKRSFLWKMNFLFLGIQMIGFDVYKPLVNYLKEKYVQGKKI